MMSGFSEYNLNLPDQQDLGLEQLIQIQSQDLLNDIGDLLGSELNNDDTNGHAVKEENLFDLQNCKLDNYPEQPALMLDQQNVVPKQDIYENNFISNEDNPGPLKFDVFIDPHHGNKSPWVYSAPLSKVYIQMNQKFPIDFQWVNGDDMELFVRATPLFSAPQFTQDIVCRCIPHALHIDNSNRDFPPHVWDHIIRCVNQRAIYEGDKHAKKHLSVVFPLYKSENNMVRQMYYFVCKNSCPSGMNRRLIEVVFTLEDKNLQILGRKTVNVRICSCPKRDKEKEEVEYYNKGQKPVQGKKRKMEKKPTSFLDTLDMKEYDVNLKIIGKNNLKAVMKYAQDLMAGDSMRYGCDAFKKCYSDITQKINNPPEQQ